MNNRLPRYSAIILMLIVGMLALVACADGLCTAYEHTLSTSADRSRHPLLRFARSLLAACVSAASLVLAPFTRVFQGLRTTLVSYTPVAAVSTVSPLRI